MYILMTLFKCMLVNVYLCVLVVVSVGRFRFAAPYLSDSSPVIRIRNKGRIVARKMKARAGLRLFADGGQIYIEAGVFFNNRCSINSRVRVSIGAGTLFGENVCIYDHNHRFSAETGVDPDQFSEAEVVIGSRCWIGTNVIILKGVRIADHIAIAAGSVVRKSIHEPGVYGADSGGNMILLKTSVT